MEVEVNAQVLRRVSKKQTSCVRKPNFKLKRREKQQRGRSGEERSEKREERKEKSEESRATRGTVVI